MPAHSHDGNMQAFAICILLQNAAGDRVHEGDLPDTGDIAQEVDLLQLGIGQLQFRNQFGVGACHGLVLHLVTAEGSQLGLHFGVSIIAQDDHVGAILLLAGKGVDCHKQ